MTKASYLCKMAKPKIQFRCSECSFITHKWSGQCSNCGAWSSLIEEDITASIPKRGLSTSRGARPLAEIGTAETPRLVTANPEFDRVLGGGFAPGALVLLGGDPGIGKSTLLLQIGALGSAAGRKTLYVSGEESPEQVKLRADRLGLPGSDMWLLCETSLRSILEEARKLQPEILIIDSIQTVFRDDLPGTPGSVNQVRECCLEFMIHAKTHQCVTVLVGHVTKDGQLAGPRMLEHMVDTVIYFEGDRSFEFRLLRAIKNRFGPAGEVGVLEMRSDGLYPIENPSRLFLAGHGEPTPGCVTACTLEGSRSILFEFQALVTDTGYAVPQRVALGIDAKRLTLEIALLEKYGGLDLGKSDIFISTAGGLKVQDPACDLALALAIASNFRNVAMDPQTVAFGELGLAGDLRPVSQLENRLREAQRQGFQRAIIPLGRAPAIEGMELIQVKSLADAIDVGIPF
jgi:DNA repair protein RadA/Sms